MNFQLSEEHQTLKESVKKFAEEKIKPIASLIDESHSIPNEIISELAELGYLGSYIPSEFEGTGLDILSYIIIIEEISKVCASTGVLIAAHTSLACDPIFRYGSKCQKLKWLPDLSVGNKIGSFLLTEPDAGSDVSSLSTRYRREGEYFIINGNKNFITNGAYLGTGIVFATSDPNLKHRGVSAFILDLETEGVVVLKNESKLGIRGSYTTAFALDEVKIPIENLLGEEHQGFKISMETLNGGRIGIAAQALGIGEGAYERSITYAKQRKQFGKSISELQAIQFKLADMFTRIEQSKLLTYKAAWAKDTGNNYSLESAMCKVSASEMATFVTKEALQIHGGYGFITEYEIERMFRDAKITEIYEGTSEIQRVVISKMLLQ